MAARFLGLKQGVCKAVLSPETLGTLLSWLMALPCLQVLEWHLASGVMWLSSRWPALPVPPSDKDTVIAVRGHLGGPGTSPTSQPG
jgi:hypothetical protein